MKELVPDNNHYLERKEWQPLMTQLSPILWRTLVERTHTNFGTNGRGITTTILGKRRYKCKNCSNGGHSKRMCTEPNYPQPFQPLASIVHNHYSLK